MTPQQTARSYDKLASHWNSDDFNRANGIEQHKRAIRFVSRKGDSLDIGCGSSGRIIDLMISEGFEAQGLDISPEMVRMAKQRHPAVTIHLADICSWNFPKKYDFISAWDSIWHTPIADHEAILRKLCEGLNKGGILIFTSGGLDRPGDVTNPFLGEPLYHAALGIPRLLKIVSEQNCICRHLEYDQYPELHIYLIIQKAEQVDAEQPGKAGCLTLNVTR